MPQSSTELSSYQTSGAECAMRTTASRAIVVALCFGEKIDRGLPLFGGLTADIVAGPDPIKDGKPFCRVRLIVNQHLRSQHGLLGFGGRVTAARNHRLTEYYFQFENRPRAYSIDRKRLQQCECLI